jgi:hypothetical protein
LNIQNTKLSIQRDALRLKKITDDIVIKMWLMDSKTKINIYKVWLRQFLFGVKTSL